MPDRPLFFYGTLCDYEHLTLVLGRDPDRRNVMAAAAPGFRTVFFPGQVFPALVRAPGGSAIGQLVLGLTPFERDLLDLFEAPTHTRQPIPVIIDEELHEADTYLPVVAISADAPDWLLSDWQQNHKAAVLTQSAAMAEMLRAKLIAARPN